ncbi:MAG: BlaI/MecI/CopY family transcriptional regulator [Bacteroidota bacterium]
MPLSSAEEQLMHHLWKLKRAYLKELIAAIPAPKPAKTTVATLLKRMIDKGMVGYDLHGNSRQYYPKVSKQSYFAKKLKGMIDSYFDASPGAFASYFAESTKLNKAQLQELQDIINRKLEEE